MILCRLIVEAIESMLAINSKQPVEELSAQHITSCTPNPLKCGGNGGCQGSIPQLGFTYTQLFGLVKEEEYPYTSGTVSFVKKITKFLCLLCNNVFVTFSLALLVTVNTTLQTPPLLLLLEDTKRCLETITNL